MAPSSSATNGAAIPAANANKAQDTGPNITFRSAKPVARPEMDYVPEEYSKQVSDYLQNFQQVRQALEKICNINRELLRRRVKF